MSQVTSKETILYREEGPVAIITLNRPHDGNMFTRSMLKALSDCIQKIRNETRTRVVVLTGAGDKFFCIGGSKDSSEKMPNTNLYPGVGPVVDVHDAIDSLQKPVIASVNGFAVGGGHVLQVMCDMTIAKESAIFRQVGPMMGSFDAGYGTWYLEDLVGKKKAKEIWMRNPKITAREALEMGLINKVVPDADLEKETMKFALEVAERGSYALASIKAAFSARHQGVSGLARITHDLMLPPYYNLTEEAAELRQAFAGKREPDSSKFGH